MDKANNIDRSMFVVEVDSINRINIIYKGKTLNDNMKDLMEYDFDYDGYYPNEVYDYMIANTGKKFFGDLIRNNDTNSEATRIDKRFVCDKEEFEELKNQNRMKEDNYNQMIEDWKRENPDKFEIKNIPPENFVEIGETFTCKDIDMSDAVNAYNYFNKRCTELRENRFVKTQKRAEIKLEYLDEYVEFRKNAKEKTGYQTDLEIIESAKSKKEEEFRKISIKSKEVTNIEVPKEFIISVIENNIKMTN